MKNGKKLLNKFQHFFYLSHKKHLKFFLFSYNIILLKAYSKQKLLLKKNNI